VWQARELGSTHGRRDVMTCISHCHETQDVDLLFDTRKRLSFRSQLKRLLLNAERCSRMVVSTSGAMARMNTVDPRAFVRVKRWLAARKDRDPLKRRKDRLQADVVDALIENYLPQLGPQA
jgi:hypothetical protein